MQDKRTPPTVEERFWAKVEKTDTCWLWTASRRRDGYGQFNRDGRTHAAHRVAYEMAVGPVPDGLELDHLCRNRLCVRPTHLEPVTRRENLLRGEGLTASNAAKTHCVNGHEFNEANTYIRPDGTRECRPCRKGQKARYKRRLAEGSR